MPDHCGPSCPFAACPTCGYAGGEIPSAATESDILRALAHTRETPASIGVDRGRGPTDVESSKMDATPKLTPAAGA